MGHLKSFQSNQSQDRESTPSRMQITPQPVVITRCNNVLTLSGPGGAPLSPELLRALSSGLKYDHVEQVQGPAKRDAITGQRLFFTTKEYKLYRVEHGKLIVLSGYMARMVGRLRKLGCQASLIDTSPARKRPETCR